MLFAAAAVLHRRGDSHCSGASSVQPDAAQQHQRRAQTLCRADVLHHHITMATLDMVSERTLLAHATQSMSEWKARALLPL